MKMFFVLILDHLSANVLTFDQNIDRLPKAKMSEEVLCRFHILLCLFPLPNVQKNY